MKLTAKLQEQIQKQRDDIRAKNRMIEEKNNEVDAVKSFEMSKKFIGY